MSNACPVKYILLHWGPAESPEELKGPDPFSSHSLFGGAL